MRTKQLHWAAAGRPGSRWPADRCAGHNRHDPQLSYAGHGWGNRCRRRNTSHRFKRQARLAPVLVFSPTPISLMRAITLSLVLLGVACPAAAHHPNREDQPVHPRIDLIPPLGNNLPPSYRRRYNRPTNIGGKIAYWIAPSSQEAMAWHEAQHMNAYRCRRGRIERHYFYPKPWEALQVGPRTPSDSGDLSSDTGDRSSASGLASVGPMVDEDAVPFGPASQVDEDVTFGPASQPVVVRPVQTRPAGSAQSSSVLSDAVPLTDPTAHLK